MKNYIIIFLFFLNCTYASDTLHFVIPDFKPFTYYTSEFKGIGVERVTHLLRVLDQPFTLTLVPNYGRAVAEIKNGNSDGFFLATKNNERDEIARFSHPLFINRWCWFSLKKNALLPVSTLSEVRVATVINTNTHKWLKKNNYNVTFPVNELSTLIPLLLEEKVDVVFVAEEVFLQQLKENSISEALFDKQVQFEKPFGIYVAEEYVQKHSRIMSELNNLIDSLYKEE